jgi:hypothetical protein
MKKLLLVVVLTAALAGGAVAQTTMALGVKVGGGMAKVNLSGVDMKTGLIGGAFFGIKLGTFTIQPEVLYAQKGMKIDILGIAEYKWNFTYIEVPVLLKRTFPSAGKFQPCVFVGPVIGMLSSAEQQLVSSLADIDEKTDIKDGFKSTDIGLAVGAGFDYKVGTSGLLVVDARVTLSLTDILDDRQVLADEDLIIGPGSMRNMNISLMVGYGFELGKK